MRSHILGYNAVLFRWCHICWTNNSLGHKKQHDLHLDVNCCFTHNFVINVSILAHTPRKMLQTFLFVNYISQKDEAYVERIAATIG